MTERIETRVFCSDPVQRHKVGQVVATPQGRVLRYVAAVVTAVSDTGVEYAPAGQALDWQQQRGDDAAAVSSQAWCRRCRKMLPIDLSMVVGAADHGVKKVFLDAEGMMLDPIGVSYRRSLRDRLA